MWIVQAFLSAIFAGITAILAKLGMKNINSHLGTALRTVVVFFFIWGIVLVKGSLFTLAEISPKSFLFLILSGLATGLSWIFYFRALQLGRVNQVVAIDKTSTVLSMVLAIVLLGEPVYFSMIIGMAAIAGGTYLMLEQKGTPLKNSGAKGNLWLLYAVLSALFASLTSILGKVGIENVESNLGTAIRTTVVLVMAWGIVFVLKKQGEIKTIQKSDWLFLLLSGLATGLSWIFYYSALQTGQASVVVPIDKLSILITSLFAYLVFKEKLTKRSLTGLLLLTAGTLVLLIKF